MVFGLAADTRKSRAPHINPRYVQLIHKKKSQLSLTLQIFKRYASCFKNFPIN
jgi:hypothetical protein